MPKTIVVLGMHRSATSLVAGGLHSQISMGEDLLPASPSNPQGHFEDRRFVRLNEQILRAAGGSWHEPPEPAAIMALADRFGPKIESAVAAASRGREIWGFKDPRTTLTVPLYLPHLTQPHFICCFRQPEEVARSLQRRNRFSLEKGRLLAAIYHQRLLRFLCEFTELTVTTSLIDS